MEEEEVEEREVEEREVEEREESEVYPMVPFPLVTFHCSACKRTFMDEKKLKKHKVEMHTSPTSCRLCRKTFTSLHQFKVHMKVHKPPSHICYICDKGFRRADNLHRHEGTHHAGGNHSCNLCAKSFPRPDSLARHKRLIHDRHQPSQDLVNKYRERVQARRRWSCATCHATFASWATFKVHRAKKHGNQTLLLHGPEDADRRFVLLDDGRGRGEEDMLPCPLCEFMFNSHKELQVHKTEKHSG